MARILIGNIKGPQGPQGEKGDTGPQGPQGIQGPLPPLIANYLATESGKAALDAIVGKMLDERLTQAEGKITQLNSDFNNINHTGVESLNFYNDNGNIGIIFSINSSEQYQVVFYISGSIRFFHYDGSNWAVIWEVTA